MICPSELRLDIGRIVSSVFAGLIIEAREAIRDAGEDPDKYDIQAYPFTVIRSDGKRVGMHVLRAIKERLEVDGR
jgi:hypothetical protein